MTEKMATADVASLSGEALLWAVAKARGTPVTLSLLPVFGGDSRSVTHEDVAMGMAAVFDAELLEFGVEADAAKFSIPLEAMLEEELIAIDWSEGNGWCASAENHQDFLVAAASPVVAVQRCYVAAKLGSVIQVPAQLVSARAPVLDAVTPAVSGVPAELAAPAADALRESLSVLKAAMRQADEADSNDDEYEALAALKDASWRVVAAASAGNVLVLPGASALEVEEIVETIRRGGTACHLAVAAPTEDHGHVPA